MHPSDKSTGLYCSYPPRIAAEVDVTEQQEAQSARYVVRNRATSRYFLLKPAEYAFFRRIDGSLSADEIAAPSTGPRASRAAIVKFLSKLDSLGLLDRIGDEPLEPKRESGLYIRFRLFNPDRFLTWLDRRIGWMLTRPFIIGSFAMIVLTAVGMLMRAGEVVGYSAYAYESYGLATILALTLLITALHEFAHGLACEHVGGEVREVGVMMIFYVLPAFFCNVTDMYRFTHKRERIWVIAAGIYWQLLVSSLGAAVWLIATPQTLLADAAFLVFFGGTFNIVVNCNPLIKLDGYYALSQMIGIPNLQSRSIEYVRSLLARILDGPSSSERISRGTSTREHRTFYLVYWLCSIAYSLALMWFILASFGEALMDYLGFAGVALTLLLAVLLGKRFIAPIADTIRHAIISNFRFLFRFTLAPTYHSNPTHGRVARSAHFFPTGHHKAPATSPEPLNNAAGELEALARSAGTAEGATDMSGHTVVENTEAADPQTQPRSKSRVKRRTLIKTAFAVLVLAVLIAPWEASTGSDCTLLLPPGHESAARANTDAVLAEFYVQPGDAVAEGTKIARLSSIDVEDRLTQLNAEIIRLNTDTSRIEDELRVRSELLLSADFKERDRQRLAEEMKMELDQINQSSSPRVETTALKVGFGAAAYSRPSLPSGHRSLPPALAVYESEIELKQVELEHNRAEVERYKKLFEQGLVGSQQYDNAVSAARVSEKSLERARQALDSALIEHRRIATSTETSSLVAQTEARAARSSFEALIASLRSNRQQIDALAQRRDMLQHERDGMNVAAPRAGVILGEDLHKMIGRRYGRGEEICRVGELQKFLLKIDVSEREIGDVQLERPVRFKLKTVPGRTFSGRVSKMDAEPITNQYGQRFYPVEVEVEGSDGLLRPGMTGFARISFGRQPIGMILAQKLWHTLRPELWLF